jgi:hypothetical protein
MDARFGRAISLLDFVLDILDYWGAHMKATDNTVSQARTGVRAVVAQIFGGFNVIKMVK